jgi:hypothetical protein
MSVKGGKLRYSQLNLEKKMEYLYNKKIFTNVHQWINTQRKRKKNTDALEYVLNAVYRKWLRDRTCFYDKGAWAYAQSIINKESGNYNERAFVQEAQRQKRELEKFVESERVFQLTENIGNI